jgi:hypothetical protein
MSHITSININITDLSALKAAITEFGAEWREGQQTYTWFGRSVGDYPLPEGFTQEDLGKCEHAIRLPGCEYEIGVVRKKDGTGFTLLYDFWSPLDYRAEKVDGKLPVVVTDGIMQGGQKLHDVFGEGLGRLKQIYGVNKAAYAARAKGYMVQRKKVGNAIKLVVTGV